MDIQSAGPALLTLSIALYGDKNVGKKTYIQKLCKKQNQNISNQLNGQSLQQFNLHLQSNHGPCQITFFNVKQDIDAIKSQDFQSFNQREVDKILKKCDSVMLMFSLLQRQSYKNMPYYYRNWVKTTENYNIVLLSTKADDMQNIKIKQKMILFHRKKNIQFYNVSSKNAYNIIQPIKYLFRRKLNNIGFQFTNIQELVDMKGQNMRKDFEIFKQQEKKAMHAMCFLPEQDEQY